MKLILGIVFTLSALPALATQDEYVEFNVNKACSELVGIPYASDNFSDEEWNNFLKCIQVMKYFDSRYGS